jgi:hypothetical protein
MSGAQRTKSEKAAAILREVQPNEAFYFYRGMNSPLNISARSLQDFLEKVNTVDAESLRFHMQRQDFEKWVSMLGDGDLAGKIGVIRKSNLQGEQLRSRLNSAGKGRLDQLNRLAMKIPR